MRSLTSTLLIGAATASFFPAQQVLEAPKQLQDSWLQPLQEFRQALKSLKGEAKDVWDDVSQTFPSSFEELNFFSSPKKHARRRDQHWDSIVKGSDIQNVWVQNEHGQSERELEGRLEAYTMRSKKLDPSKLGVDPAVKQYSGYLDDDDEDKHLFYCAYLSNEPMQLRLIR